MRPASLLHILALAALLQLPAMLYGQETAIKDSPSWEEFVGFVSTDENAEREDWAEYIDGLHELHLHPLDINTATLEDLRQIPILSDNQAEDIRAYVLQYGSMKSLGELMAIRSMDNSLLRFLPLFCYAGSTCNEPVRHDTLRFSDGRHDLLSRAEVPLYRRKGEADGRYAGRGTAHRLRYNWNLGKRIAAGFGFEKDACEPLDFKAGYDHWSGYAQIRGIGWLRNAVIGDYRMGWGEGLLVNNRFSMGKSAFSTTISTGISGHKSASEYNFMRGAAATIGCRHMEASVFYSMRLLDAGISADGTATTLYTSGLHRTEHEIRHRHDQRQTVAGSHLAWRPSKAVHIGATAFAERYTTPWARGNEDYRQDYPEGRNFWGAAIDYSLRMARFTLHGETAINGNGAGTLNHLQWRHSRKLSLTLSQRYYSAAFHSFMGNAFCESEARNEHGYCLTIEAEPLRWVSIKAYADAFFRPRPIYNVPHSTNGQDARLQALLRLDARNTLEAKWQWKHKEVFYALYMCQGYQLIHKYTCGNWTLRTHLQARHHSTSRGERTMGWSVQPTARWTGNAWQASISAAWFHTADYYSRIYLSQPSLSGLQTTSYYGHGLASAAMVSYAFRRNIFIALRYSVAGYFDRSTIGTGAQAIGSPVRNDVSVQLRLKL